MEENSVASKPEPAQITRRQWLGQVSLPAVGAALGAGILGEQNAFAAPKAALTNDLGARVYNVREFGAKGDGVTVETAALQAAIDACTKDGGGTVLIPAGTFVIGTVELKSNVTLHIAAASEAAGKRRWQAVSRGRRHSAAWRLDAGGWKLGVALCGER